MYYIKSKNDLNRKKPNKSIFILIMILLLIGITVYFILQRTDRISKTKLFGLLEKKEFSTANKLINREIQSGNKLNWWIYYSLGIIYYNDSEYLTSLLFFRKALVYKGYEAVPNVIYYYIGDTYYKLGKGYYSYSIKYLKNYLKYENRPLIPIEELYFKIGSMLMELQNIQEADSFLSKIYAYYVGDQHYQYYYAQILYYKKEIDNALGLLNNLVRNAKDLELKKKSSFMLGKIYFDIAKYPESIKSFLDLIELQPDSDMSYYYLGYCYMKLNETDTAKSYLNRALMINKNNADVITLLKQLNAM